MDLSQLAWGPTGWGDELASGFALTIRLGATAILIGTLLGLATSRGELSGFKPLAWLMTGYGAVMRSVPELLVIFLLYYGASFALQALLAPFGFAGFIEINAFWAGTIALALIHAAYASEAFCGAFLAIPSGQIEAAQAFGMGRAKVFARIELPLAMRLAFGSLTNLAMSTLKNTPLVSAIGLQDLIRASGEAAQNTKFYFLFFMMALAIYLLLAALALLIQTRTERALFQHLQIHPASA